MNLSPISPRDLREILDDAPPQPSLPRRIAGDILVGAVVVAIWAGTFAAIGGLK